MSCTDCRIAFLEDNLGVMTAMLTRMNNVLHCSENSGNVSDVQRENVKELTDVRQRWKGHVCNHSSEIADTAAKVIEELPLITTPESVGIGPKKRGRPPGRGRGSAGDQVSSGDDD